MTVSKRMTSGNPYKVMQVTYAQPAIVYIAHFAGQHHAVRSSVQQSRSEVTMAASRSCIPLLRVSSLRATRLRSTVAFTDGGRLKSSDEIPGRVYLGILYLRDTYTVYTCIVSNLSSSQQEGQQPRNSSREFWHLSGPCNANKNY